MQCNRIRISIKIPSRVKSNMTPKEGTMQARQERKDP